MALHVREIRLTWDVHRGDQKLLYMVLFFIFGFLLLFLVLLCLHELFGFTLQQECVVV